MRDDDIAMRALARRDVIVQDELAILEEPTHSVDKNTKLRIIRGQRGSEKYGKGLLEKTKKLFTNLSRFTTSRVSSDQHDRVVVDGFHDLLLHGEDRETGSLLGALHQSIVGLVAFGPVVVDVLE